MAKPVLQFHRSTMNNLNKGDIDGIENDDGTLNRHEKKQLSAAKRAELKKRMDDYVYKKEIRDILYS
ncbi:hypothetical protein M445_05595 [Vibrio owensii 47666-1]|uniref:hypothetical protein n=1 Tax=Vibrio owensii TaxID=696485 RepID=UPI000585020D|nr:hypothetical protein [Vibrio owensii]KIF48812.1 hypothetical protein M445_05595 [Vibrio owensii 47666-1]